MSLPFFVCADPSAGVLDGPEGRHAVTVKRIAPGELVALTDGQGTVCEVEVESVEGKDTLRGRVAGKHHVPQPTPRVTIVQAVPKSDHAELAVDLATQGGADAIIPWISERTIARWQGPKVAKHVDKWRGIALQAVKQSRRAWVPEVAEPVTTNQLADMVGGFNESTLVAVLNEDATQPLAEALRAHTDLQDVVLVVGPEGGIGESELSRLLEAGAVSVRLGPEVLRTASAAFAGLSVIGALTSRW